MAVVFLAEDLKHHRRVAIKLLKPELSAVIGIERFAREIEIACTSRTVGGFPSSSRSRMNLVDRFPGFTRRRLGRHGVPRRLDRPEPRARVSRTPGRSRWRQ
jgi:serine/threonine protein kinase